ncbi:unnamed protein product [Candida verbasci]|uniref:protein-tyrosine-phosphatase n=1 Tax=Candida verbasci TaxID=1227364 RepID=A0A9W4TQ98_9ASCO|nr:unnamed protein product [Candida verbasci]
MPNLKLSSLSIPINNNNNQNNQEFTFPTDHLKAPHRGTTPRDSSDYFVNFHPSQLPPSSPTQQPPQSIQRKAYYKTHHKSVNDSIGSIISNTSDLTICESNNGSIPKLNALNTSQNIFKNSTDTLVEDEKMQDSDSVPMFQSLHSIPTLKKQMTMPNIKLLNTSSSSSFIDFSSINQNVKLEQSKRINSLPVVDYKSQIENLSPRIKYVNFVEIESRMSNLDDCLIIDIRPFVEFVKNHLISSLNICLPSTLLKRPNFSLIKSINSLPEYEQTKFKQFLDKNSPDSTLIIYDTFQNSLNLFYYLRKVAVVDNLNCNIYLISGSLFEFQTSYPQIFTNSTKETTSDTLLPPIIVPPSSKSPVSISSNSSTSLSNFPTSSPMTINSSSTPILTSQFQLPKSNSSNINNPLNCPHFKFKTDDLLNEMDYMDQCNKFNLYKLNHIPADLSNIPNWLTNKILAHNVPSMQQLNLDYYNLEKLEKERLHNALNNRNAMSDEYPTINNGIEYGSKNRYKDILLYNHSRINLNHNKSDINSFENYINASMLSNSYVASQAPLQNTIGDFYRMITNDQTKVIISLTESIENGMQKCVKFWTPGTYQSHTDTFTTSIINEATVHSTILRIIRIVKNGSEVFYTFQIQLLSWLDMESLNNPANLLEIIQLKQSLIGDGLALVHCSAGCGRTGTYCVMDTMISKIKHGNNINENTIFTIANDFRKQRMNLIQNCKQFYLIYDVLLIWYNTLGNGFDGLIELNIVNEFKKYIEYK